MRDKIIKILLKKTLIGMVVVSAMITSCSFLNANEACADFNPGESIYVDADNNSGIEDGSAEYPYNTIQEGIDDANGGDTIFVNDGTYNENIDINKNHLSILSMNGAENTIVNVLDSNDHVFEIKADYVALDGFTVKGFAANGTDYFKSGIYLKNANHCKIFNNVVSNSYFGIYLLYSNNNTLTNNIISDNHFNFFLSGNSDEHFNNNIDVSNTVNGKPIYYIQNAENQVYGSSTNAGAFYCISCNNVTVKDLTLNKNGCGIFFRKTENSKIENIKTSDNMYAIRLRFSNNNTFTNNTVLDNMSGIGFYYSDSNISTDNIISKNMLGFSSSSSNNNIFTGNIISENGDGISFFKSEDSKVFHNNFINNRTQLDLMNSAYNFFDNGYPSGGNYWSDYNGVDLYRGPNQNQLGKDGIGDTPYELEDIYIPDDDYVTKEVYDNYPLMEENGWENPIPFCGNGLCEEGETFENCYQDCAKQGIEKYFPYWKFSQGEEYHPTGFYFDNDADVENNRENYEKKKGDWAEPYVYAHIVEDENYFTIQYWMYMAFNHHRLAPIIPNHEHDFDATIFVIFNKNNLDQPIEVRFARHIYIGVYPWNEIERINTTHPVAYVAQGSHGAYRSENMGSLDVFETGGLIYNPNFFNYYKVGNCIEEIEKEINGEQREFCKVENELLKGEEQNEPANGYWPKLFTGEGFNIFRNKAPWHSDQDRWFQTQPKGLTSALEFGVDCPVDLHIYDPKGRHIGINYQTNEPEIQIPEAIFQQKGEKQYIMIPNPIKGDYKVEIIGTDNGEYDFTMIASEDMKLIEKEEKKKVPIIKDETQIFVIPNLWENPREIKQKAIDDLESIENDNKIVQKNIKQAIKFINKSLNQSLWIDDSHLDKRRGISVFQNELRALMYLKSLRWQKKKLEFDNSQISPDIKKATNRLTKSDEILAEIIIKDAKEIVIKNDRYKERVKQLINKSEKELNKAKQESKGNRPIRSIIHSQSAWHNSQMAIRLAEIPVFDYFKKSKTINRLK